MARQLDYGPVGLELVPPSTRMAIPQENHGYRIIDILGDSFGEFTSRAIDLVSETLKERNAVIPEIALREIIDNLVHAVPCSASIVIDPSFKNVFISDTGPGISRPDLVFELGYSTATVLQRSYIRGVGIGLSLAREDIRSRGGDLHLETSPGEGAYVRIALPGAGPATGWGEEEDGFSLTQRQNNILFLLSEGESLGPSGVAAELNIGVSTAHRDLVKLQELGLICLIPNGKRFLSEVGRSYLQSLLSL